MPERSLLPDVNGTVTITADKALGMWEEGVPVPSDEHGDLFGSRRVSPDNKWFLKLSRPHHASDAARITTVEFERVKAMGLNVVSFANLAISPRRVVTVTPYIDGLVNLDFVEYCEQVLPVWEKYYQQVINNDRKSFLSYDAVMVEQYYRAPSFDRPFALDVEALLETGVEEAEYTLNTLLHHFRTKYEQGEKPDY